MDLNPQWTETQRLAVIRCLAFRMAETTVPRLTRQDLHWYAVLIYQLTTRSREELEHNRKAITLTIEECERDR
jgi:hypothetical protein